MIPSDYFPVLVFIIIGLLLGLAMLTAGTQLSKSLPDAEKNSPYECGFPAFENSRIPFDVRFYLVAILFIIFDLETAFFFPWALALRQIGWFGFAAMMLFLGLLVIGFIYEWKRGALEWE
jgi:NADH-quinone oxidoreductase subunit A